MATVAVNNLSTFTSFNGGEQEKETNEPHDFQNFQTVAVGPGPSTASSFQQQPFYMKPSFRFKTNQPSRQDDLMQDGPGRRLRKNVANVRKHIDYIANVLNHVEGRLWQHSRRERYALQPDVLHQQLVLPAASTPDVPVDCVLSKFVRSATNKVKCPIYTLCWTPEGKRIITGASSGEFTLWNGTAFNFETILQAHDVAVRALKWSHNDQWMASADHDGFVKYWQPNMNNVHMFQAHKDEPIRSISFSPSDGKLLTGSDDSTARVWDFARCVEERVLRGHGADVRSVDWHPTKGLVATGSRDSQQPVKLWDPKSGQCLTTLHDHKNSVMSVQWNRNGNWLLTGSRDHLIKLYDIRMMKEVQTFRGHKKEVTSLAWHPVHEGLFVSGGGDGSLGYWLVNTEKELALLEQAHDQAIWTLDWHPLGHILATGSNDNNTKFWTRNRPGDTQEDVFGLSSTVGTGVLLMSSHLAEASLSSEDNANAPIVIPGMGLDEEIYGEINRDVPTIPSLPGLGGMFDDSMKGQIGAKKTLIKQPPPKRAQRQFERMWMVSRPGGGNDVEEAPSFEEGNFFNIPSISLASHAPPNGGTLISTAGGSTPTQTPRQPKGSLLGAPPPPSKPRPVDVEAEGVAEIYPPLQIAPPAAVNPLPQQLPQSNSWLNSSDGAPPRKMWKGAAPHQQQMQPRTPSLLHQRPPAPGGFMPPPHAPHGMLPPGAGPRMPPPPTWNEDWHQQRGVNERRPNFPPPYPGNNQQFRRRGKNMKPYNS